MEGTQARFGLFERDCGLRLELREVDLFRECLAAAQRADDLQDPRPHLDDVLDRHERTPETRTVLEPAQAFDEHLRLHVFAGTPLDKGQDPFGLPCEHPIGFVPRRALRLDAHQEIFAHHLVDEREARARTVKWNGRLLDRHAVLLQTFGCARARIFLSSLARVCNAGMRRSRPATSSRVNCVAASCPATQSSTSPRSCASGQVRRTVL